VLTRTETTARLGWYMKPGQRLERHTEPPLIVKDLANRSTPGAEFKKIVSSWSAIVAQFPVSASPEAIWNDSFQRVAMKPIGFTTDVLFLVFRALFRTAPSVLGTLSVRSNS
jgi:hypothetical protein